jgi:uncharacterized protein YebE (UPF0316 family)
MPIVIVLARVTDVSLGTLRIMLVSKGHKKIAPIISFFESLIWILVAGQIIKNISMDLSNIDPLDFVPMVAYALGYALGTYIGMKLEVKLSLGKVLVRAIVSIECMKLETALRNNNYGLTSVDANGKDGMVKVLFIVINRTDLHDVMDIIKENNPNAFYTIEGVQSVNAGYFPEIARDDSSSRIGRLFLPGGRK